MVGLDVILGGVTGLLGNLITGIINYKTMKAKNSHDAKMVALETAAMRAEAKMQIEVTKAEVEGTIELADADAYMESIKQGNKQYFGGEWIDRLFNVEGWLKYISIPAAILVAVLFGFIDWLRGFMRPALTLYLTGLTTVITYMAWEMVNDAGVGLMSVDQALGMFSRSVEIVIYLTVSVVTWWFGDRRTAKFIQGLHNNHKEK